MCRKSVELYLVFVVLPVMAYIEWMDSLLKECTLLFWRVHRVSSCSVGLMYYFSTDLLLHEQLRLCHILVLFLMQLIWTPSCLELVFEAFSVCCCKTV